MTRIDHKKKYAMGLWIPFLAWIICTGLLIGILHARIKSDPLIHIVKTIESPADDIGTLPVVYRLTQAGGLVFHVLRARIDGKECLILLGVQRGGLTCDWGHPQ